MVAAFVVHLGIIGEAEVEHVDILGFVGCQVGGDWLGQARKPGTLSAVSVHKARAVFCAQRGGQITNISQPPRKQRPPSGVIAPSHFTFVRARR